MKLPFKIITTFIALAAVLLLAGNSLVFANGAFQGGNFYIAGNTSNPSAGWSDPITVQNGDIVEFQVAITNSGPDVAQNVQVKADLPTNANGSSLVSTIHITADNTPEMTDTVTVNISSVPQGSTTSLTYFPGHAILDANGGSTKLPETISTSGVSIGSVLVGDSHREYITFKATAVVNIQPTPTPTPTATPVPTATPTPVPTAAPGPQGPAGLQGPAGPAGAPGAPAQACTNNSCNLTANLTANQTANQTGGNVGVGAGVTTLPKTGLPELAWSALAFIPAGLGLRRFRGMKMDKNLKNDPNYIWEDRKFKTKP